MTSTLKKSLVLVGLLAVLCSVILVSKPVAAQTVYYGLNFGRPRFNPDDEVLLMTGVTVNTINGSSLGSDHTGLFNYAHTGIYNVRNTYYWQPNTLYFNYPAVNQTVPNNQFVIGGWNYYRPLYWGFYFNR